MTLYVLSVWLHVLAAASWVGRVVMLVSLVIVWLAVAMVRGCG